MARSQSVTGLKELDETSTVPRHVAFGIATEGKGQLSSGLLTHRQQRPWSMPMESERHGGTTCHFRG